MYDQSGPASSSWLILKIALVVNKQSFISGLQRGRVTDKQVMFDFQTCRECLIGIKLHRTKLFCMLRSKIIKNQIPEMEQ